MSPRANRLSYDFSDLACSGVVASGFIGARPTDPTLGTRRLILARRREVITVVIANCWRKYGEIDSLAAIVARLRTAAALLGVARAGAGPFTARFGPIARCTIASRTPATALRLLIRARALLLVLRRIVSFAVIVAIAVAVHFGVHPIFAIIVIIAIIVATLRALLLIGAGPAFAEHAEVMIGKLQIIFGLDAITGKLRIARHALVFFEQLGGIAALPIVLAIAAIIAGHASGLLSTATATAAGLTIIDQAKFPRRTGACRA